MPRSAPRVDDSEPDAPSFHAGHLRRPPGLAMRVHLEQENALSTEPELLGGERPVTPVNRTVPPLRGLHCHSDCVCGSASPAGRRSSEGSPAPRGVPVGDISHGRHTVSRHSGNFDLLLRLLASKRPWHSARLPCVPCSSSMMERPSSRWSRTSGKSGRFLLSRRACPRRRFSGGEPRGPCRSIRHGSQDFQEPDVEAHRIIRRVALNLLAELSLEHYLVPRGRLITPAVRARAEGRSIHADAE